MVEFALFIDKDTTLSRYDEIARRLRALGAEIKAQLPTVNLIVVTCEERSLLPDLRSVPGVVGIREGSSAR